MPSDGAQFWPSRPAHRTHGRALLPRRAPRLSTRSRPPQSLVSPTARSSIGSALSRLPVPTDQFASSTSPADTATACAHRALAHKRGVAVKLTGLDLNPDAIAIAAEATPSTSNIVGSQATSFAGSPTSRFTFVVSSLFTHHLAEADLIHFVQWMEVNSKLGWFINDLSRAATPLLSPADILEASWPSSFCSA